MAVVVVSLTIAVGVGRQSLRTPSRWPDFLAYIVLGFVVICLCDRLGEEVHSGLG